MGRFVLLAHLFVFAALFADLLWEKHALNSSGEWLRFWGDLQSGPTSTRLGQPRRSNSGVSGRAAVHRPKFKSVLLQYAACEGKTPI